jgi:hypothetical protein
MCALDYTCDYTDTKVRFYDTVYNKWCPWTNIDGLITYGGCTFWNFDLEEDVTQFYGPTATQMQFAWDLMDVSSDGDFCEGKHKSTDNVVDNVSIGFYDGTATVFSIRYLDLLQDSFHESIRFTTLCSTPTTLIRLITTMSAGGERRSSTRKTSSI